MSGEYAIRFVSISGKWFRFVPMTVCLCVKESMKKESSNEVNIENRYKIEVKYIV